MNDMDSFEWLLCPVCNSKTRIKLRLDTELKNFPLFCPKCKQETLISVEKFKIFFNTLEAVKLEPDISFSDILLELKKIRNTYEMSFSSKLLHTIKPEYPIWDSVVTKEHFGIRPPYASCKNREQLCIERYDLYQDRFYDFMSSDEGAELIRIFDHQYPNNGISNVKKIDFIMWQDR